MAGPGPGPGRFTESAFERKCADLNRSEQSIQGLSMWLIHHRKHSSTIFKIWYEEFLRARDDRKLTFMYLANDIVQSSLKEGPELGKAFIPTLKKAFEHMGKLAGHKTKQAILRILGIWRERGIFEDPLIDDFQKTYLTPPGTDAAGNASGGQKAAGPSSSTSSTEPAKKTAKGSETDGIVQDGRVVSPSPYSVPPTEEELLSLIKDMEKMPSMDPTTRCRISSFLVGVLTPEVVEEICVDSDAAREFEKTLRPVYHTLCDVVRELESELLDRKKITMKLQDFRQQQKELLAQAEQRLEEHDAHVQALNDILLKVLGPHVSSLPDLNKLPTDTNGGLPPLPSLGDLFP